MPNCYPKHEHIRYIEPRARQLAMNNSLEFVDVIAQSAAKARNYLVGVRRPSDEIVHRLRVPLQVVERCMDASRDDELVATLNQELAGVFPK